MEGGAVLRAHGVARRYGALAALEPTDVELRAGELVVLVGPNGAGKSTLLALLAGALPPSEGTVERDLPADAIGWAPQRPALYQRLSARENLELFARLAGLPAAAARAELEAFELPDDGRPASQLSVGTKQRLNLALAFLGSPRLLLLDEPTASLDPPQARALWARLARARDDGAGAAVATHLLDEADAADRVLALSGGRVVFEGTPAGYREAEAAA